MPLVVKIVGATLQHITYTEFLPSILGQGIIEKYGLALQSSGFFAGYDININAGIANSVSSQALKFVASLLPNTVAYFDEEKVKERPITDTFYAPFDLYKPIRGDMDTSQFYGGRSRHHDMLEEDLMPVPDDPDDVVVINFDSDDENDPAFSLVELEEEELPPDVTEQEDAAPLRAGGMRRQDAAPWRIVGDDASPKDHPEWLGSYQADNEGWSSIELQSPPGSLQL
ncbi:hypothetical protein O3P69_020951 [Scylla paramamosain]|uniref:Uncharacterized protein n=1 Tax=Scylla paramamosain TaxID=85552 RepID=A0AAW0SCM0_SCYPA